MRVTQNFFLDRLENKCLKWYERVVRMEDNRWHKRIMKWSPEGRQNEDDSKQKLRGVMKKGIITSDDTINWRLWRLKMNNRWTNGKMIHRSRKVAISTNGLFLKGPKLL